MRTLRAALTAVMLVELLGACAGGNSDRPASSPPPPSAQQRALEQYLGYAGPPIPYFVWLGHLYSWEPLGKDRLVVFTTTNEAYLLKVWPPCDFRFGGIGVGLTSRTNTVYARNDSVITGRMRCPIDEIRKIDYPRMRSDLHRAPLVPADPSAPAQPPAPTDPTAPPHASGGQSGG
jgi:hypothetical protein